MSLAGTPRPVADVVSGTGSVAVTSLNVEHLGGGVVRVDWADGDPEVFSPHDVARVTGRRTHNGRRSPA